METPTAEVEKTDETENIEAAEKANAAPKFLRPVAPAIEAPKVREALVAGVGKAEEASQQPHIVQFGEMPEKRGAVQEVHETRNPCVETGNMGGGSPQLR